jgi:nicotinamidase-related amidase
MSDTSPAVDPRHTALLVMDFQPAIVGQVADGEALLERVAAAIAIVRQYGGQIGYVRVGFDDSDLASVPATSRMAVTIASRGQELHADAPGSAIHDHVAPAETDIVVRKTRVGAFSTTDLAEQLRDRDLSTLILSGISTSGVVLSTVRDAHDRDFQVLVLADGCADRDPDVHDFLMAKIFPRQADVISIEELSGILSPS